MANLILAPLAEISPPADLDAYLAQAEAVIWPRARSADGFTPLALSADAKLRVGVDLGTAYLVLVVLAEDGTPLAGEWQYAEVVRDGLVVDYIGAVDLLRGMKSRVEARLGRTLDHAASAFPPGVPVAERRATGHVLDAAGLSCSGLLDEPSAANNVLNLRDGAIVDVGGGTTGIAILQDGAVVYTADEATGGTHFSLVIAGALDIPFEQAEALKITPAEQARLFPVVRPVMEKVGSIIQRHTAGKNVPSITLVGGTVAYPGMAQVVAEYTGIPTRAASHPLFITPLGMALHDSPQVAGFL